MVEPWKLKKFFPEAFGDLDIDPLMSLPVFCMRLTTCGDRDCQVWVDSKDKEEDKDASRVQNLNLFHHGPTNAPTWILQSILDGSLQRLTNEEADYIHYGMLQYRAQLFTPEGKAYIDEIAKRAKEALPDPNIFKGTNTGQRKFHPIGALCVPFEMPPEPWADPQPTQPHYDDF